MFENLQIEDNYPDIREISYQSIERNYLYLLLVKIVVITSIFTGGITYFLIPKIELKKPEFIPYIYIGIISIFSLILLVQVLGFFKRKYAIRQKDITFRHGILVHSITTIPFSRIQHIEIDEGAFERMFKLASLNIYTAGDNGRDLKISGITKEKAEQMKEIISNYLNDESE